MLTAKAEEFDKVLGLESGADDYLTKPFGIREFIARVKAILRRQEQFASRERETMLQAGDMKIDIEKRQVQISGTVLTLPQKNFNCWCSWPNTRGKVFQEKSYSTWCGAMNLVVMNILSIHM